MLGEDEDRDHTLYLAASPGKVDFVYSVSPPHSSHSVLSVWLVLTRTGLPWNWKPPLLPLN